MATREHQTTWRIVVLDRGTHAGEIILRPFTFTNDLNVGSSLFRAGELRFILWN